MLNAFLAGANTEDRRHRGGASPTPGTRVKGQNIYYTEGSTEPEDGSIRQQIAILLNPRPLPAFSALLALPASNCERSREIPSAS
jgi:hypothetical protein